MKHDLHYLVNTNESTQNDTLPDRVASDISVANMLSQNRRELMLIHVLSSFINVLLHFCDTGVPPGLHLHIFVAQPGRTGSYMYLASPRRTLVTPDYTGMNRGSTVSAP